LDFNNTTDIPMNKDIKLNNGFQMKMMIILLVTTLFYFCYITTEEYLQQSEKDEIVRFHVIANSDSQEDQELKLKVRDSVIELMNVELKPSESIAETKEIIKKNLSKIEDRAALTLKEEGHTYPVKADLGMTWIPEKQYGKLVFPAGEYQALNIVIGEGKGQNWWCVLFPPLCFIENSDKEENTYASLAMLTQEQYNQLMTIVTQEKPVIKIKFKAVEVISELLKGENK
jgi:stage II sporulation protein R